MWIECPLFFKQSKKFLNCVGKTKFGCFVVSTQRVKCENDFLNLALGLILACYAKRLQYWDSQSVKKSCLKVLKVA